MDLSTYLIITPSGILAYLGDGGRIYEVVGGDRDGNFALREIE